MKRLEFVLLSILLLVAGVASAQTGAAGASPARVRGIITAIDGNTLSVKSREGKDLRIEIAPDATFSYMKKLTLADVKPGTPLGTSAVAGEYAFIAATVAPDGKMTAQRLQVGKDGVRPPQ